LALAAGISYIPACRALWMNGGAVNHRRVLCLLALLPLITGLLAGARSGAQDKDKPLIWGADCDGGIPYVIKAEGDAAADEPDGPVTGFEADLRDALARQLRRRIVFKQLKFENLFMDLDQGHCDFAMNGLEITAKNTARAAFSRPYYLYQQQLVVRADEQAFVTLEECQKKKLTVGTLAGSAAVTVLQEQMFAPDQIKSYQDQDGLYEDLSLGRNIRGVLLDLPAAIYYTKPYPQLQYGVGQKFPGLKFLGQPFADGQYGIAVKQGNSQLLAQLNAALDALKKNGELKRVLEKWDLWNVDQYKLDVALTDESRPPPVWTFSSYFPLLLQGAYVTVQITLCGFALAMLIGLPLALMRLYGPWYLRALAIGYVEFFRGIPVLLLLYFLYYGLGHFAGNVWHVEWLKLSPYTAAILGFGLNYAAYEAEIYRAGISSIPLGQWEAAASLGMPPPLTFRRIILPQAIRVMLPPMTNDFVALFKDTSVVSIIAVTELSTEYQILTKSGGNYVEIGLCTAALYLIMSVPLGYLSRYLEKRWSVKG
jgi:polar amino acid transport system substrate-binding protein